MRAGPLSDAAIIEKLNQSFVNTWILRRELPRLKEAASSRRAKKLAEKIADLYEYPVDSMVFSAEGEFLGHRSANALMKEMIGMARFYLTFLEESLSRTTESRGHP